MRIKSVLLSLSTVVALSAGVAHASTNLVTNGSFETTTNGSNKQLEKTATGASDRTTISGWTSSEVGGDSGGYNFVLDSKTAATTSSVLWLSGTDNGYSASPDSGNFFASDKMYYPGTLSQTISGLTVGTSYTLTFDYALAQQTGYTGGNTGTWAVSFGDVTQNTSVLSIAEAAFSGWKAATMTFTATGTSELLSFLSAGTPTGAPPFMLLDGVSMVAAVPEPSTWAMMLGGIGLVGWLARRRRAASHA
jgi:hypothetical protein